MDLEPSEEVDLYPISEHTIASSPDKATVEQAHEALSRTNGSYHLGSHSIPKKIPTGEISMTVIAAVIRSKNRGALELMLDIMFSDAESRHHVKSANVVTNQVIKKLYRGNDEDTITNMYFVPVLAWKCTLKRLWRQGSFGQRDTLGAQQYAPLLYLRVPVVTRMVGRELCDREKRGEGGQNLS